MLMQGLVYVLFGLAEVCLTLGEKLKKSLYTDLGLGERGRSPASEDAGARSRKMSRSPPGAFHQPSGATPEPPSNILEFALSDFIQSKSKGGMERSSGGVESSTPSGRGIISMMPTVATRGAQVGPEPLPQPRRPRSSDKTLVLDMDETLIHANTTRTGDVNFVVKLPLKRRRFPSFPRKAKKLYVRKRPHLNEFLATASKHFEIVLFTAARVEFAMAVLDVIDPERKFVDHCLARDNCLRLKTEQRRGQRTAVVKDLGILGRPLSKVIMLDNSPRVYRYHLENGLPISSWYGNQDDTELASTLAILEQLAGAKDVRDDIIRAYVESQCMREEGMKGQIMSPWEDSLARVPLDQPLTAFPIL
ncbi:unnamed protein product [Discosporangium mesarthrocarpum]